MRQSLIISLVFRLTRVCCDVLVSGDLVVVYRSTSYHAVVEIFLLDLLIVLSKLGHPIGVDFGRIELFVCLNIFVIYAPLMLSHQDVIFLPLLFCLHLRRDVLEVVDFLLLPLKLLLFLT